MTSQQIGILIGVIIIASVGIFAIYASQQKQTTIRQPSEIETQKFSLKQIISDIINK